MSNCNCQCGQDRKPLTAELSCEDSQLERQAEEMCEELSKDKDTAGDVAKARHACSTCRCYNNHSLQLMYPNPFQSTVGSKGHETSS